MNMRHRSWMVVASLMWGCGPDTVADAGESDTGGEQWEDGRSIVMIYEPEMGMRLDLLVVVDDSPSMRAHVPTMANNVGAFAQVLSAEEVGADVRVLITTTSVPGPTCMGAQARGGEALVSSCREHLEDFVGVDEHGEYGGGSQDLADACNSVCSLDGIERVPSPGSDPDSALALRPWIEAPHNEYGGNLADGDSFEEALSCALLQGFAGCEFESPIEAAARMVERMHDPLDELFGFRRPEAPLLIMMISDEDDCSHPESSAGIFDPNGTRVFWPPGASEPLSAICVNASLLCDANGCELADHDASGALTNDASAAVLYGPQRLLDALAATGELGLEPPPVMSVIGGYGPAGNVNYEQPAPGSQYESYAALFGIGPGCTRPDAQVGDKLAAPGGRLAATSDALTPEATYSICEDDWTPVLGPIVDSIKTQIRPKCFVDACFDDLDPDTSLLEPDCVLELVETDATRTPYPSCQRDAQGWVLDPVTQDYLVPDGVDTCWVSLTDADGSGSASTYDDMSPECTEIAAPGEWKIARRPESGYIPYAAHYELRCRPCP